MIIDCTMFHWEFDLLELRMRELWDTVDYFFVTESVCDHRGNPRKLVLSENVEMFSWATDRLVINISDKNLEAKTTWDHEKYQRYRSVIDTKTKFDLKDEDFIIISDIDEIPRPAAIKEMAEEGGKFTLHMPMYYYYLNLYVQDWYHPKALSVKYLTDPNDIRTGGLDKDFHIAYNSGWHFSYLGNEEQIRYKIKTFAHDEMDTELFTDIEHIRSSINSMSDLFDRFGNSNFTKLEIDGSWPENIIKNKEKYKDYILN
jgi:hypothetical protein